ncbi:hypothetical protein F5890DRAFT_1557575 [Lentinula detonsa]|uniref:Uncharacterized protein n=1 Tax=Lentinula detonsa TaxID=2804962 RepID=A0AA38UN56_9AGAR|nr:hypothetical protein F5890DRAFT_1557575 [Lentinula detonsa]
MNMLAQSKVFRAQDRDFPILTKPFAFAFETEIVKTDPKDLWSPQHIETVIMSDKALDESDPKLLPQADIPIKRLLQSKTRQLLGESRNRMQLSRTVQVRYEPCSNQVPSYSSYSNSNSNNVVDSERKSGTPDDRLGDRFNDAHVRRLGVLGKTHLAQLRISPSPLSLPHQWESPPPPRTTRTTPLAADPLPKQLAIGESTSIDEDVLEGVDEDKASEVPSPSSGSSPLVQAKSRSPKASPTRNMFSQVGTDRIGDRDLGRMVAQNVPEDVGFGRTSPALQLQLSAVQAPGFNDPIILNVQVHNTNSTVYNFNNAQGDVNHTTNNDGFSHASFNHR